MRMKKNIYYKLKLKRIISIILVAVLITGTTTYARADIKKNNLDDSLIGQWDFESITDKVIEDISNNGKDGELKGNAISSEDGINGKGIKLSGEKGSFVSIPSIINPAKGSFSVSLWAKVDKGESDSRAVNTIILQQEGSGRSMMFRENSPGDKFGTYIGGENKFGSSKLSKNIWNNLIITVDSESKLVRLYVNGKLESDSTAIALPDSNDKLRIGDHKNSDGRAFNGFIDEVKIYDKVITQEDVNNLYREFADIEALLEELNINISKADEILAYCLRDLSPEVYDELNESTVKGKELNKESSRADIELYIDKLAKKTIELEGIFNSNLGDTVLISSNLNNKIRTIGKELFGVNHRYHKNGYESWDTEEMKMDEDFDALYKDASFGSLRYPGGTVSNLFQWKRSIGPVDERLHTIHGNPNETPEFPYFGIDEAAQYAEDNNSEFIYVYGAGNGSAQDGADLVEYLNCEVGENPNGGIDWAKVRADNGRVEPYNVTQFEFGNEFQLADQGYWTNAQPNDRLGAYLFGGEFNFNNELVVEEEDWKNNAGKGTGEANQRKFIKYAPVMTRSVTVNVAGEIWNRVEDFKGVGAQNVYILDELTGEIKFGNGIDGVIPKKGNDIRVSYRADKDGYLDVREAMKSVDPDIKLYTSYETVDAITRLGTEHDYDGIVVHPYSGTINSNDPNYYEKILYRAEEKVKIVKEYEDKMKSVLGEEKAKEKSVIVSEYGIFRDTSRYVKSQVSALYTSKLLMGISKLNVPYANRHCLIDFPDGDVLGPGQQAVIQAIKNEETGDYDYVATPSAKIFSLFNRMTGENVIDYNIKNNKDLGNSLKAIDTMITTDNDGNIYLMVVNSSKNENVNTTINIQDINLSEYKAEVWTVDGPSFDAENTIDNLENVDIEKNNIEINTSTLNYDFTPHSLTAVKLTKEDSSLEVDKSKLSQSIDNASKLHSSIVEGINNGEYHVGAREKILSEINSAKDIMNKENVTQEEIDEALVYLNDKIGLVKTLQIDIYTGDLNGDKIIDLKDLSIISKSYGIIVDKYDLDKDGLITIYEVKFIMNRIN